MLDGELWPSHRATSFRTTSRLVDHQVGLRGGPGTSLAHVGTRSFGHRGPKTSCDTGVSSVHLCLRTRYNSLSKSLRRHRSRRRMGVWTVAANTRNDAVA